MALEPVSDVKDVCVVIPAKAGIQCDGSCTLPITHYSLLFLDSRVCFQLNEPHELYEPNKPYEPNELLPRGILFLWGNELYELLLLVNLESLR